MANGNGGGMDMNQMMAMMQAMQAQMAAQAAQQPQQQQPAAQQQATMQQPTNFQPPVQQRNMVTVEPPTQYFAAGPYNCQVDFLEQAPRLNETGQYCGEKLTYQFTILDGPYATQTFRQWYTTDKYTQKILGLVKACGVQMIKTQTPKGVREAFDTDIHGALVTGDLDYEDTWVRFSNLRPYQQVQGQTRQAPANQVATREPYEDDVPF